MKPDTSKAPSWANFMARDKNGKWYWYEAQPTRYNQDGEWQPEDGTKAEIIEDDAHYDWKQTVEEI